MRIVERVPNFVDRDEPPAEAEFSTLAELSAVPFVQRWASLEDFHRFSLTASSGRLLMAEFKRGNYWAVGHVKGTKAEAEALGLPQWEARKA